MARNKETTQKPADLVTFQPKNEPTVLPPESGIIGSFLEQTANMFRARAMRMNGLLRKIDESGQRMEAMLRTALEKSEAAEAVLQDQFGTEGLLQEAEREENQPIG
jgi:hypothetical protein